MCKLAACGAFSGIHRDAVNPVTRSDVLDWLAFEGLWDRLIRCVCRPVGTRRSDHTVRHRAGMWFPLNQSSGAHADTNRRRGPGAVARDLDRNLDVALMSGAAGPVTRIE